MTERMFAMPRVETELVGDVWPAAQPAADAVLFGRAELEPTGAFEARSLQTFTLRFTVGRYGIDDTGTRSQRVHPYDDLNLDRAKP